MGAQTVERKHKFIQRFNEVEKSEGECLRTLIDNRGLSPLRTPNNFAELWVRETPWEERLSHCCTQTIQREIPASAALCALDFCILFSSFGQEKKLQ